jgi:hypothetical protein
MAVRDGMKPNVGINHGRLAVLEGAKDVIGSVLAATLDARLNRKPKDKAALPKEQCSHPA